MCSPPDLAFFRQSILAFHQSLLDIVFLLRIRLAVPRPCGHVEGEAGPELTENSERSGRQVAASCYVPRLSGGVLCPSTIVARSSR